MREDILELDYIGIQPIMMKNICVYGYVYTDGGKGIAFVNGRYLKVVFVETTPRIRWGRVHFSELWKSLD
jgi:hypothetical protein